MREWWTRVYFWPFSPEEIDAMQPRRAFRWGRLLAEFGMVFGALGGFVIGYALA